MYKYATKRVENLNGDLIGYSGIIRIEGSAKTPQKYDVIFSMILTKHPKVVLNNGVWEIKEDTVKKLNEETKNQNSATRKTRLMSAMKSDLTNATKRNNIIMDLLDEIRGKL